MAQINQMKKKLTNYSLYLKEILKSLNSKNNKVEYEVKLIKNSGKVYSKSMAKTLKKKIYYFSIIKVLLQY